MRKNILFQAILAIIVLSSCSVTKTETAKTIDIYGSVVHKPVVADLVVKETRITGSAVFESGSAMETIKNFAVADALKKANADVMIEPKFETETNRGKTTVIATGWAGNYKNFRSVTNEDLPLLESGVLQRAKVYEPTVSQKDKGNGKIGLWIAVALAVSGAAAYLLNGL